MDFLNLWTTDRIRMVVTHFVVLVALSLNASIAKAEGIVAINAEQTRKPLHIEGSPDRVAEAVRGVFRNCDDNLVARLCRHSDTSTSLFAAWERTKRRCLAAHLLSDKTSAKQGAERSMAWFAGFVEGRLKIDSPERWRHTVERGCFEYEKYLETDEEFIIGLSTELPESPLIQAAPGILTHFPTTLSMVDDRLVVGDEEFEISVPRNFIDQVVDSQEISGNVIMTVNRLDANSSIVVVYGTISTDPCLIARIAIGSNKTLWKRKVQVTARHGGGLTGPGPWHSMDVRCDSERIVLFGAGAFGIYVTGFAEEDGKRLFTFFSYDE